MDTIKNFFKPRGVALIGASSDPSKLSHGILKNLLSYGFEGGVYPVNPKSDRILDLPCYPSITEVPDPVDLAVIILPAPYIAQVVDDCGKRGIRSVIVISGGFKEVGPEGLQREMELLSIAEKWGIRIIGPNCVGTVDLHSGLNTSFIKGLPPKGGIAFISQSGAVCGGAVDYLLDKGLGFSHFISLGNQADVSETDMIAYLAQDPAVKVIAIYAESIRNGARFIETVKQTTPNKPVLILKAGRSVSGAKAVSSHTGSLAGSNDAYQAAFEQSGAIVAHSMEELFVLASVFSTQPLPFGNRVAIVTNAGGPAALASDVLDQYGLSLATLHPDTIAQLRAVMSPAAQLENPVDMLGGATPEEYCLAMELVLADANVDAVIPVLVPQALVNSAAVAQAWVNTVQTSNKPVTACIMGEASVQRAFEILRDNGIPSFVFPEDCARGLGQLYAYANSRNIGDSQPFSLPQQSVAAEYLNNTPSTSLGERETRTLLSYYDIPMINGDFAKTSHEAQTIAENIGYPVAMKIVSPHILHKSDAGGIVLNLQNAGELLSAYDAMMNQVSKSHQSAQIEGVLIEKMAPKGVEVIVGMKRDPSFGPLMMFGLGGIYVELFKDVAFGIAPLTRADVNRMIDNTKASALLAGIRGGAKLDREALVELILHLSAIAQNHPQIQEIEINPLLILPDGQGVMALDARAILEH
jgi:acetate---CoA ligase (ADP-forming)